MEAVLDSLVCFGDVVQRVVPEDVGNTSEISDGKPRAVLCGGFGSD